MAELSAEELASMDDMELARAWMDSLRYAIHEGHQKCNAELRLLTIEMKKRGRLPPMEHLL